MVIKRKIKGSYKAPRTKPLKKNSQVKWVVGGVLLTGLITDILKNTLPKRNVVMFYNLKKVSEKVAAKRNEMRLRNTFDTFWGVNPITGSNKIPPYLNSDGLFTWTTQLPSTTDSLI